MPPPLIVVGLGNPGARYKNTPHNIGFEVVDLLAERMRASSWRDKRAVQAELAEIAPAGGARPVLLVKPYTYMNLSGRAVAPLVQKEGSTTSDVIVVCDDVNLELGRIRFRQRGSSGGQKGLLSIIESLGTEEVPRLRLGIRPMNVGKIDDLSAYVLHKWWGVAREIATMMVDLAEEALECALRDGVDRAMNQFNNQRIEIEPKG